MVAKAQTGDPLKVRNHVASLRPPTPGDLRIVTWNCNMAFARKADRLLALQPDVAIVQECSSSSELAGFDRIAWTGAYERKGMAVFARPELSATVGRDLWDQTREWFIPIRLDRLGIDLLACWAMNHHGHEDRPRKGRTMAALAHYEPMLAGRRAIVIGDLNNNVFWDRPAYPDFANITGELARHGLVNLHYARTGEIPGNEWNATLYFLRNADRRYLIDHVFLPAAWLPRVSSYAIGAAVDWLDVSDHVPVVVDLRMDVMEIGVDAGAGPQ